MPRQGSDELAVQRGKGMPPAVSLPQPTPVDGILGISRGTLKPALEAVRVLVRAQGAALFIADDHRRVGLRFSTFDDSLIVQAPELCAAAARSGRVVTGAAPAFIALPLFHESRLAGVLYLEGLTEMSRQSEKAMHRCARILACMLANVARWTEDDATGTAAATRNGTTECGASGAESR